MRIFFALLLLLVFGSCKKENTSTAVVPPATATTADSFYFKAKLNGTQVNWVVPSHKMQSSFAYHAGAATGYSDLSNQCLDGFCYYMIAHTQIFTNVTATWPQMNAGFNMATASRSRDEVLSWFVPGPKAYQASPRVSGVPADLLDPGKNGVYVYYIDAGGKSWFTGGGSQQGSVFESVSFADEKRTDVTTEKVWKARFACKLYDASGNFITVEDGEILGPILLRY